MRYAHINAHPFCAHHHDHNVGCRAVMMYGHDGDDEDVDDVADACSWLL